MGNCCKAPQPTNSNPNPSQNPNPNPNPKSKLAESTATASLANKSDQSSLRYLKFKSKGQNFSYKLEYHSQKSLSSYLNHIIINNPELAIEDIQVLKQKEEITDYHMSLHDLEILPSEVLYIEACQASVKKSCSSCPSVSEEEIAEEESTTKFQIAGIQAKLNIARVRTESTGESASLWRSAMPSPKVHHKQPFKDADASSLINPMDLTIENKAPIQFLPYDVKNGQSVLVDSDDSFLKNDAKARDSIHRHPYDFFKDLQGPFSVLKQL